MQIYLPHAARNREISAKSMCQLVFMPDRFAAIRTIQEFEADMSRISNHGRLLMQGAKRPYVRMGTLPWQAIYEIAMNERGTLENPDYTWMTDAKYMEELFKSNKHFNYQALK